MVSSSVLRVCLMTWCWAVILTWGVCHWTMPVTDRTVHQSVPVATPTNLNTRFTHHSHSKPKRAERRHVLGVVRRLMVANNPTGLAQQVAMVKTREEIQALLMPHVLLNVEINPESRVKIKLADTQAMRAKVELHHGIATRFLLQINNQAGVTSSLNLTAIDLSQQPPQTADWITVALVNEAGISNKLSGKKTEYLIVEIVANQIGLKEIRLVGDAGQGTQDLGFRATADFLIDVE